MSVPERRAVPALLQVDAILTRLEGRAALTEVCRYLRGEFAHYPWIGVYRRDGPMLILEAWQGDEATEHTRIPVGQGLCGQAARENRTVIVDDVTASPEYLACFASTRSEIVVPIRDDGGVLGEIDVDGTSLRAFDTTDQAFLERVAAKLVPSVRKAAGEPPPPS